MSKKIFAKPYRGVGEQVQQFADRGMVIDIPVDEAAAVLRSVTYYRFSGYALPFRDVASGSYTGGLKFCDVVALYRFDCRLRELVGNALGAVEVTFDREAWKGDICSHFNTLPPTIENRVRGYVEFPKDAESSPLLR